MSDLANYVVEHIERGACTCGKCFDAPENPVENQPQGHTVDLTFFKCSIRSIGENSPTLDEFVGLVRKEYPQWLDGNEHSYIEVGAEMGDQGIALMTIAMGDLVGAWKALSPDNVMPFLPDELKKRMAGMGMVTLKYPKVEIEKVT